MKLTIGWWPIRAAAEAVISILKASNTPRRTSGHGIAFSEVLQKYEIAQEVGEQNAQGEEHDGFHH